MGTLTRISIFISLLGAIVGSIPASASAVGPAETGFLTITNPATGQDVLLYCEDNLVDSIAFVDGSGETDTVGAPMGTDCSVEEFASDGFIEKVNLDPHDGWVIVHPTKLQGGTMMAYACTNDGAVYGIKNTGEDFYTYERNGPCGPGYMPG